MKKKLSSEDFLKLAEELWESGPKIKYQNVDNWTAYLLKNALTKDEEEEKKKALEDSKTS